MSLGGIATQTLKNSQLFKNIVGIISRSWSRTNWKIKDSTFVDQVSFVKNTHTKSQILRLKEQKMSLSERFLAIIAMDHLMFCKLMIHKQIKNANHKLIKVKVKHRLPNQTTRIAILSVPLAKSGITSIVSNKIVMN